MEIGTSLTTGQVISLTLLIVFVFKEPILMFVFGFKNIDPESFIKLNKKNDPPLLIDVRTEGEYNSYAFKGSRNIPLGKVRKTLKSEGVPTNKPIYLVCASGTRSIYAACSLRMAGYKIFNLKKGVFELAKASEKTPLLKNS